MRLFIAFAAVVGSFAITTVDAVQAPKKEDIPSLINTLKTSQDAKARAQAAEDISHVGAIRASYAASAIDPLVKALKSDKIADVRRACAKALGDINIDADKCVPALTNALKDSAIMVKIAAAQALGQFGSEAQSALPALMDLAKMKETKNDKKLSQFAVAAVKSIKGVEKKK